MANIRLKIELNRGKRGISLDKLEKVVLEMRRFLESMSDDIELAEPESWVNALLCINWPEPDRILHADLRGVIL